MKTMLKRLALLIGVGIVILAGMVGYSLSRNAPIEDGLMLGARVRTVKDGMVSVFVLDTGDGGVVLIDAGNDPAGKAIAAELARRKLDPSAVKAIFLTHGHPDHVAACAQYPSAQVYALAADVSLAEGREAAHSPLGRLFGPNKVPVKISHAVQDGETITVGKLPVQVLAVPGHTAGSAAYLADGVLFLGDSAGAHKDGRLAPAVSLLSDNPAENRRSLKALAARLSSGGQRVETLAFAHTGPLSGLRPLLDFAAQQ